MIALFGNPALAADPVDLGVLQNQEIQVIQKRLHVKQGRTEMGAHLGVLPFDPFTIAPKVQLSYGKHRSETRGWEVQLGFGYGIANRTYRLLDSPAYGKVPEATRYLGSITGGLTFSPIYAKMSKNGKKVFHHDIYFPVVAGVTLEQTVDPHLNGTVGERFAIAPTLGTGVGARVFLHNNMVLRVEMRDDFMVQFRAGTGSWNFKQNIGIHAGITILGDK
jgi:outer membrane beta-barrel protein